MPLADLKFLSIFVSDDEIKIRIDRKELLKWVTAGESDEWVERPLEAETTEADPNEDQKGTEPTPPIELPIVDIFAPNAQGVGGILENKKVNEVRDWLREQKFSYKNFCLFLQEQTHLGPYKLKTKLLDVTKAGQPSLFTVAARWYLYWQAHKETIANDYKEFLKGQLEEMGYTVQMACDIFEGEVVEPSEIPVGTEVQV